MKKGTLAIIGLILFIFSFLSIILRLIGLKFLPLAWLDVAGVTASFAIKFFLLFLGIIFMYYDLNKDRWLRELEADDEYIPK